MHILIYNPLARGNRGETSLQSAIDDLNIQNYIALSVLDLDANLAKVLQDHPKGNTIVLIGGDGTLSTFINKYKSYKNKGLVKEVLFYSGGTGNDFIRNFDNIKLLNSADYINKLKIQLQDRVFNAINSIGAGIDSLVIKNYHKVKKIRKYTYVLISIKSFFACKPSQVKLILDGEEFSFEKCWLVSVNNGKYIGGGMNVAPLAKVNDDLLDVCVVTARNKLVLFYNFIRLFLKGSHIKLKNVFYRQAKEVEYISSASQYIQYDGELVADQTNSFKVAVE